MKTETIVTPIKKTDDDSKFNLKLKNYKGIVYDENHTESELRYIMETIDNSIGAQIK